jgi:hypothetical protein
MKYTPTFATGHCFPPENSAHPSLCNGYSISATAGSSAGSNFLESYTGQSVTIPEYLEYPCNDALSAVISFSERKINHKGQTGQVPEGQRSKPCFSSQKFILLLLVGKQPWHKFCKNLLRIQVHP